MIKFPRWFVISVLISSLLALPLFGIWWWARWPQWTLHEFLILVAQDQTDEASQMVTGGDWWVYGQETPNGVRVNFQRRNDPTGFTRIIELPNDLQKLERPTVSDRLAGRWRIGSILVVIHGRIQVNE